MGMAEYESNSGGVKTEDQVHRLDFWLESGNDRAMVDAAQSRARGVMQSVLFWFPICMPGYEVEGHVLRGLSETVHANLVFAGV
ncbi:hypothetical protein FRX31_024725 [Thalictrum thalictroides]|uniref:Uncharacterized protein n=1 Tax=Thalictrum thalictroides TaxID=46969 RepID=A0A7J6VM64_THATH|nr:hypothetical protein FRX31_024725 [Thalictrum thalictroides]